MLIEIDEKLTFVTTSETAAPDGGMRRGVERSATLLRPPAAGGCSHPAAANPAALFHRPAALYQSIPEASTTAAAAAVASAGASRGDGGSTAAVPATAVYTPDGHRLRKLPPR